MIKFITIQKLAQIVGIDISYIRKMIKNKDLIAYKKDGYKRVYINIDEFNSCFKPINNIDNDIDLDKFLI
ncbi:MAG: helix-turn-helix domain-containing protein [Sulfurimonas sp.]|uniref:helix-turn-helix domain-containing protein n=1 Tax=Sulfurimonas sp. TaxID=2022749 RepID=UPI0026239212|nr:helix-turn-helix domain-containing protein [Sulfurimonas sp.]MDD5400134.1 helix-turn-helix domain-containing protein [Sulfurimonas sp.]